MANVTDDFAASFHALTGTTMGERRKNLFLLLNRISPIEAAQLDFSRLHPKTQLEEKFKLEALIRFRRVPELVEVLKSENPMFIKRLLKVDSWFFDEAFMTLSGEELTTTIFPHISFNAKTKLAKKLSLHVKSCEQADDFFESIRRKYSLHLASKLLPACSADVIINCLENDGVKLRSTQLLSIIKKHPQLTERVMEKTSSDEQNVFKYFAQHDMELFLKLCKKYNFDQHLGWRLSDKIIRKSREDVIKNSSVYRPILHEKQLVKKLDQDIQHFYFNLFPKSLKKLTASTYEELFNIIKNLPEKVGGVNLLLETFEKAYGEPLWNHPKYVTLDLLAMLPLNEREDKLKSEYRPKDLSDEEWMCYSKTEISIPYLKNAISLTSDASKRTRLIQLLVETCKLNNDKAALADVCRYIVKTHRNDEFAVRRDFLDEIDNKFDLETLEEQHWTAINELLDIFKLKDECFYMYNYSKAAIYFRLTHDLPIHEQITKWVDAYGITNILKEHPKYEKTCLLTMSELLPEICKELDEEGTQSRTVDLLLAVMDFNKRNRDERISLFSFAKAMDVIRDILTNNRDFTDCGRIITYCIKYEDDEKMKRELLNLCFTKGRQHIQPKLIRWLLQHQPTTVFDNMDAVADAILERGSLRHFLWNYFRYHSHLEAAHEITKICRTKLEEKTKNGEYDASVNNSIKGLLYLATYDEFRQITLQYYPIELRTEAEGEQNKQKYKIQLYIASCLRYSNPSSLPLETILQFCKGDYLKLALGSVYSLCSNVNEDKLAPIFGELSKRAVSVRKHALHLTRRVQDRKQIYKVLEKFIETEKNASVRKFIFKNTFEYFTINSDDHLWELVKLSANTLDTDDESGYDVLMQYDQVPLPYVARYVLFTWEFSKKMAVKIVKYKLPLLLDYIQKDDIIKLIPKDFCKSVIEDHFFKDDELLSDFHCAVQEFTCSFMLKYLSGSEQEEYLKYCFKIVGDYMQTTLDHSRGDKYNAVGKFLTKFCNKIFERDGDDKEIVIQFSKLWNSYFQPHDAFSEYLYLQLTLIYAQKLSLPERGQEIAELCDALTNLYGATVIDLLYKEIENTSWDLVESWRDDEKYSDDDDDDDYDDDYDDELKEKNWYTFIESLIVPYSSVNCLLLVILLINDHQPTIPETRQKYNEIIEMLNSKSDLAIQLHLQKYFRCTRIHHTEIKNKNKNRCVIL